MTTYVPRHRAPMPHIQSAFQNSNRARGDYRSPLRKPVSFHRVATCSECRADLYAKAGQDWRHEHNGSYWCSLASSESSSWAFPAPQTIEFVKYFNERVVTYRGSRRYVMLHTPFHRPKHRLEGTGIYENELTDQ